MPDKVYAPSTIRARLAMLVLLIALIFIGLPTFIAMAYVPAYVREMDRLHVEEFERRLLEEMREEDMRQPEGPIRVVMDREREDAMVQIRRNLARGLDPQGNPLAVPPIDDDMPPIIEEGISDRLTTHLRYQNGEMGTTKWEDAKHEIDSGQKTSHWIWYVFPSLRAVRRPRQHPELILRDLDEVRAYADVEWLRSRLRTIISAATVQIAARETRPDVLFGGHVDAEKFWECVTVFFLVTANWRRGRRVWKELHEACAQALEAMRPYSADPRTRLALNPAAVRAMGTSGV